MKYIINKHITRFLFCFTIFSVQAQYVETIQNAKIKKDLVKDYGLKNDNAKTDQSDIVQSAIDNMSKAGGGILHLSAGIYAFCDVYMNSNVHLVIDKEVVIKPFINKPKKGEKKKSLFYLTNEPKNPKNADTGEEGFIENISIRCAQEGEYFVVDYSHLPPNAPLVSKSPARAFIARQVRNFLVEGMYVKDNWTTFGASIYYTATVEGCEKWEVRRPTNGLVRNFKSTNSTTGYGLTHLHACENLHFENISTTGGGVTLRMETYQGDHYGGLYGLTANNVHCENGWAAVQFVPHDVQNGLVKVTNVTAVSCEAAVKCGAGWLKGITTEPGRFADGCIVENIRAVYGETGTLTLHNVGKYQKEILPKMWYDKDSKEFRGPSMTAVWDDTGGSWKAIFKNVTMEGFPEGTENIVRTGKTKKESFRTLLKDQPIWKDIPEEWLVKKAKKKYKKKKK